MRKLSKLQKPLYIGDDGVLQTLLEMERLVLRDAKEKQIKDKVRELTGTSDVETVTNIYNFVWQNWRYKKDPDTEEHLTAPIHLLNNCDKLFGCKHVDCDDYSMLLSCLLEAAGFRTGFRVLSWRNKNFTHVYNVVMIPSLGWTPLDAVMKEKGLFNEKERKEHRRTLTFPVGKTMETMLAIRNQGQINPSTTMGDLLGTLSQKDQDVFSKIIGGVVQGKPILDVAQDAAQAGCEAATDGYIAKKKKEIIIACIAAGVGGLALGVGGTWLVLRK